DGDDSHDRTAGAVGATGRWPGGAASALAARRPGGGDPTAPVPDEESARLRGADLRAATAAGLCADLDLRLRGDRAGGRGVPGLLPGERRGLYPQRYSRHRAGPRAPAQAVPPDRGGGVAARAGLGLLRLPASADDRRGVPGAPGAGGDRGDLSPGECRLLVRAEAAGDPGCFHHRLRLRAAGGGRGGGDRGGDLAVALRADRAGGALPRLRQAARGDHAAERDGGATPARAGGILGDAAGGADRDRHGGDDHGLWALHLLRGEPAAEPRDDADDPVRPLRPLPLPLPRLPQERGRQPRAGVAVRPAPADLHHPLGAGLRGDPLLPLGV
ncbi:MAG: 5-Phosphoribosyl diphosphate (PRPP): decaprenyl-phosphate 5-phosphoribosyltransferase, partial [uncultured Thermomicrobiales bacterium]